MRLQGSSRRSQTLGPAGGHPDAGQSWCRGSGELCSGSRHKGAGTGSEFPQRCLCSRPWWSGTHRPLGKGHSRELIPKGDPGWEIGASEAGSPCPASGQVLRDLPDTCPPAHPPCPIHWESTLDTAGSLSPFQWPQGLWGQTSFSSQQAFWSLPVPASDATAQPRLTAQPRKRNFLGPAPVAQPGPPPPPFRKAQVPWLDSGEVTGLTGL